VANNIAPALVPSILLGITLPPQSQYNMPDMDKIKKCLLQFLINPMKLFQKNEEALVKFKKDSSLEQFLLQKSGNKVKAFTFKQILVLLYNVIQTEKLYDSRNPSVILCSEELEGALNKRAFHITELRDLVISQIENNVEFTYQYRFEKDPFYLAKRFFGNQNTKFGVQPAFLCILRSVEGVDQTRTEFSMTEILELLSKYIMSKEATLIDDRSDKIAIVKNDPLGEVFKVAAFDRCQVRTLVDKQLVCLSLKQEAAWMVVRCLKSNKDVDKLDIPRELKSMLIMMNLHKLCTHDPVGFRCDHCNVM